MDRKTKLNLSYYYKIKQEAIDFLGGKCTNCNSNQELQFHHKDPSLKRFTISSVLTLSKDRWISELEKCQLLCKSCHRKLHSSRFSHGTAQRYWRGCRCQPCTTANTLYSRLYKTHKTIEKNINSTGV